MSVGNEERRALAASAGSGPEDAARSRKPLLQREGRPGVAGGWRTGGTATDKSKRHSETEHQSFGLKVSDASML